VYELYILEKSILYLYKKDLFSIYNIICTMYTICTQTCTEKGKNKSEEDIQRYKPDPYEYTLNDM
jgi:hypothetical protein